MAGRFVEGCALPVQRATPAVVGDAVFEHHSLIFADSHKLVFPRASVTPKTSIPFSSGDEEPAMNVLASAFGTRDNARKGMALGFTGYNAPAPSAQIYR